MKVLYIMGNGRSGSTIMNSLLGNHPKIFACGELCHLVHPMTQNILCSCGTLVPQCPVWSEVFARLDGKEQSAFSARHLPQQHYFEIYRTPYEKIENALTRFIMTIRRLNGVPGKDNQRFHDYAESTRLLYQTIINVTKKTIIVDSSKNILKAYWLSQIPEIELYILHMVRDGRGVAASGKKALLNEEKRIGWSVKPLPVWRTSIAWTKTNLMIDYHLKHNSYNSLFVRYDDFAKNPKQMLVEIGHWMNIEMSALITAITNETVLPPGHTMGGNAGRMRPIKKITHDNKWKDMLNSWELLQFNCIAGLTNRKYGFK